MFINLSEILPKNNKVKYGLRAVGAIFVIGLGYVLLGNKSKNQENNKGMMIEDSEKCNLIDNCIDDEYEFDDEDEIEDKDLKDKHSLDELTQEELDSTSDYEYLKEWLNRPDELYNMSLDEYEEIKCIEDYGLDNDEMDCGDEESVIID